MIIALPPRYPREHYCVHKIDVVDDLPLIDRYTDEKLAAKTNKTQGRWGPTEREHSRVGLIGECAACRAAGVQFIPKIYTGRGDDGHDVINKAGALIEVKTACFTGPDVHLKLTEKEFRPGIYYALVQFIPPSMAYVFPKISSERFMEIHGVEDYGHGHRMIVTARQLIDEFLRQKNGALNKASIR